MHRFILAALFLCAVSQGQVTVPDSALPSPSLTVDITVTESGGTVSATCVANVMTGPMILMRPCPPIVSDWYIVEPSQIASYELVEGPLDPNEPDGIQTYIGTRFVLEWPSNPALSGSCWEIMSYQWGITGAGSFTHP